MNELEEIIKRQIEQFGPINIAEFMTQCLLHPKHGYYTTGTPLGAQGDFITAPEISQMFGEMLGLCLAQNWIDQGQPNPFCLAEIGPGNATLMSDILRVTKSVPNFQSAMKLYLVEASPSLRETQNQALSNYNVTWIDGVNELPELPLFLVANEFYDCLPIRQFLRTENGWQEQMIGVDTDGFHFVLGTETPPETFAEKAEIAIGELIEVSSSSVAITSALGKHISDHSGMALIIDYGEYGKTGDTLQALKQHKKVSPLVDLGTADLTAHVDFEALTKAAKTDAQCTETTPQGILLERLGITQRAQSLANKLSGEALENHITAHKRLTHPDEMGRLFKAIAITPKGTATPEGF